MTTLITAAKETMSVSAFIYSSFICEADLITIDPTYTSRIIVPVACLKIIVKFEVVSAKLQNLNQHSTFPWVLSLIRF